jgi:hypothetical protein
MVIETKIPKVKQSTIETKIPKCEVYYQLDGESDLRYLIHCERQWMEIPVSHYDHKTLQLLKSTFSNAHLIENDLISEAIDRDQVKQLVISEVPPQWIWLVTQLRSVDSLESDNIFEYVYQRGFVFYQDL